MIVYPLILIFSLLLIYQICFQPLQEGVKFKPGSKLRKMKKKARGGGAGKIRTKEQVRNEGMGNMGDRVLKNHDEIVKLKAVLDTQYKPLIESSKGDPTNLLTRLATLESSVEALEMEKLKEQNSNIQEFEGIEDAQ